MDCQKYKDQIKQLQEEINRYRYDHLTGLLQRRDFENDFFHKFTGGCKFYLTLVDINNLHVINRDKGYRYGDMVIRRTATALLRFTKKEGGVIYRIGGDEFAVLSTTPVNLARIVDITSAIGYSKDFESNEDFFKAVDESLIRLKEDSTG
jgi:diguanylate cyclase (GGDEF)-like protein